MATTLTTTCDPIQLWQQEALTKLQQALGQSLDIWTFENTNSWILQSPASNLENPINADTAFSAADLQTELLDEAKNSEQTVVLEHTPGEFLFAIPLGITVVATTSIKTNSPKAFIGLADVAIRYFQQQEDIVRLQEENEYFLKQVSDDFEELTFLRSMADRLGLGESAHSLEQLVSSSLPELGKSVHAEELHYFLNTPNGPDFQASWLAHGIDHTPRREYATKILIQEFRHLAELQPLIKNAIDTTSEREQYPGIRDFVIVPVGESDSIEGWFVAVNRIAEDNHDGTVPEWRLNQHEFGTSESSLLSTAAAMISSHANNISLFQEREALLVKVVRTLVYAVEAKDQYTCGHSERVALYAKRLAEQVGYSEEACELLYLTGLLHDIGKIAINDAILNKPDRLTDEEFAEIQRHPDEGWKILHELQQLSYVLPGVLHHHERFDGKGYPDGLSGQDIPLDGRVLAVADAYDAMTSNRAYRNGMHHDKAIDILSSGAGSQWDPEAVQAFLQIEPEITDIRENYQPRQKPNRVPTSPKSQCK